jgi:RNA polymerase sigma-70 factor (ECF subfamily)
MSDELSPQDEATFREFFRATYRQVYRAMRVLAGSHEEAEDITNEAFTRAYAIWEDLQEYEFPTAWILRTADHVRIDRWRKWGKRWSADVPIEDVMPAPDLDLPIDPDLAAALRKLSPQQRRALAWRYLGGLSRKEIASILGVEVSTVAEHLERGLAELRELLAEEPRER